MSWETRIFFKLPPTEDGSIFAAPSLTNKEVVDVFGPFITANGISPLSPNHPERRSDNYLVTGGKYGGFVGVKLRNQQTGKTTSKLEVKTCISVPVTKHEGGNEGASEPLPDELPIALPALTCWNKVSTNIRGPLDKKENVEAVRNLIKLGGQGHTLVGSHAAGNLVVNPESKQLIQIILAKQRLQGWCTSSVVFEETDVEISVLNMSTSAQQIQETWRSWAFEGGSYSSLEKIAKNWAAIFDRALSTIQSTSTQVADPGSMAFMKNNFQVASYPEFVQYIYLERLPKAASEGNMKCKM